MANKTNNVKSKTSVTNKVNSSSKGSINNKNACRSKSTTKSRSQSRKEKKQKKILARIGLVTSILLGLSTILFMYKIIRINIIPTKYFLPLLILTLLFDAVLILGLVVKNVKLKLKKASIVIAVLLSIINVVIYCYIDRAFDFIDTLKSKGVQTENYQVLVLSDSNINTIEDLNGKMVSYVKTLGNSHKAMEELKKKVGLISNNKTDSGELISGLLNKSLTAVLIEDSYVEMIKEQYQTEGKDFSVLIKSIYTLKLEIRETPIVKEVDVVNDTFALYISGIDTFGDISTVSRSDVNIVAVVNPKTKQVLLISIPRDYYVKLHGIETDMKDKLTHAGMYGIETSVKTIEDILDIDINYYLKVNFTSVVDIVDALGGIEVDSKYAFSTYDNYSFKKGINKLDGLATLYFSRERYAFSGGDRVRGQNQQAVITAIIKKAATPSIITKYDSLLKALDGKFQTNIGSENISKLIKMQLNDMASWKIKSISLDGTDSSNYTYSYPKSMGNSKNYVMEPNLDTIKKAQDLIRDIKGNLLLDSIDDNKVYNTYTPVTSYSSNSKLSNLSSSKLNSIKQSSSKTSTSIKNSSSSKSSSLESSSSSMSSIISSSSSSFISSNLPSISSSSSSNISSNLDSSSNVSSSSSNSLQEDTDN